MNKYAITLAVLAGVPLFANQAVASPACCAAPKAHDKLIAASTEQVNTSLVAAENKSDNFSGLATTTTQVQEQKLEVTTAYSPSVITVEKGKPVVLKVHRKDARNCGGELLIPEFDIRAEIAAGRTTEVKFTPMKSGTFPFTCGMQMVKGQIVVKDSSAN